MRKSVKGSCLRSLWIGAQGGRTRGARAQMGSRRRGGPRRGPRRGSVATRTAEGGRRNGGKQRLGAGRRPDLGTGLLALRVVSLGPGCLVRGLRASGRGL